MGPDDFALTLQRLADRVIHRLRAKPGAPAPRRRFLIVQIDGLSRTVFERGLAEGYMPFVGRLLARRSHRVQPMAVGMPTSTPAFQMSIMYGIKPDIPGFHYHDKRRRADVHFPRAGHACRVEAEHAAGLRGILEGGSAYGCVFTGGAANNLFSFARLCSPTADGLLRVAASGIVLGWVALKCLTLTAIVLTRQVLRVLADPVRHRWVSWRWLTIKLGISVWLRELFTLAVARDLYRGVPVVYVNYLDYDVFAHGFGPGHRRSLYALRRVDAAIKRLVRVVRRVPEYRYDVYVLSDHGMAWCRPFAELSRGRPFERAFFEKFLQRPATDGTAVEPDRTSPSAIGGIRASEKGTLQRFLNYLEEDFAAVVRGEKEALERDGLRVVSAGPNAFVYLVDEPEAVDIDEIERRLPGLAEALSRAPGVGYVLARSADGPVCWWRGKRHRLDLGEAGPFAGRDDLDLVLDGVRDLMAMRSAGDLVVYGIDAPGGHVSYMPEIGAHAGTSPEEIHTFIIQPAASTLPLPLTHPTQLYPHFMSYQEGPCPDSRL